MSVLEMYELCLAAGHRFGRDPFSGRVYITGWRGVPHDVRVTLIHNWDKVRAITEEFEPYNDGAITCAENLIYKTQ